MSRAPIPRKLSVDKFKTSDSMQIEPFVVFFSLFAISKSAITGSRIRTTSIVWPSDSTEVSIS